MRLRERDTTYLNCVSRYSFPSSTVYTESISPWAIFCCCFYCQHIYTNATQILASYALDANRLRWTIHRWATSITMHGINRWNFDYGHEECSMCVCVCVREMCVVLISFLFSPFRFTCLLEGQMVSLNLPKKRRNTRESVLLLLLL